MKKILSFLLLISCTIMQAQELAFRTIVDKLRLRESPNLESKVVLTIPINSYLLYLNEKSKEKTTVTWQNGKATDYWYKIRYQNFKGTEEIDTIAWVFAKGVTLSGVEFPWKNEENEENRPYYNFENQWISIKTTTRSEFDKQKLTFLKWKSYDQKEKDSTFTLKYDNGKKEVVKIEDEEGSYHSFIGELVEYQYYWTDRGQCCSHYSLIKKKDGSVISFDAPFFASSIKNDTCSTYCKHLIPIVSPDKTLIVTDLTCEPGGEDGIAVYGINTNEVFNKLRLNVFPAQDFRFVSNNIFIAKMNDETYYKIILKE